MLITIGVRGTELPAMVAATREGISALMMMMTTMTTITAGTTSECPK